MRLASAERASSWTRVPNTRYRPRGHSHRADGVLPVLLLALMLVQGCSVVPPREPVPLPDIRGVQLRVAPPADWWMRFDDPAVTLLVSRLFDDNLDLREATARIVEARAFAVAARAPLLPSLSAGIEASRSRQPAVGVVGSIGRGGAGDIPGDIPGLSEDTRFDNETWSSSLTLSYEPDLWGGARAGWRAALAESEAAHLQREAVAQRLLGELLPAYFDLRLIDVRAVLARQQVDLIQDRLQTVDERYLRGLDESLELYQVDQALRDAQALLPRLQARREQAVARIALLVGSHSAELDSLLAPPSNPADRLAALPIDDLLPDGVPMTLLRQRPDVAAAAARLEAARQRIGERIAARLPSAELVLTGGLIGESPSALFDPSAWFSRAMASLLAPVFQGGRLAAQVDVAWARYEADAAAYARTVLEAVADLQSAQARVRAARQEAGLARVALEAAEASAVLQRDRYLGGIGDFAGFLDAGRTLLDVRAMQAQAWRDIAVAQVDVHRAVGGRLPDGSFGSEVAR